MRLSTAFCVWTIFAAAGCSETEAARVAERLVEANLVGHDSHGVIRIAAMRATLNQAGYGSMETFHRAAATTRSPTNNAAHRPPARLDAHMLSAVVNPYAEATTARTHFRYRAT